MAVFTGNGSKTAPSFTFSSDTNTGFYRVSADSIGVAINSQTAARFDSSGALILGRDATIRSSAGTSTLAIEGSNTTSTAQASLIQNGGPAVIELGRAGGAALASTTAVSDQDILGAFRFSGADGTTLVNAAGLVATAEADWTGTARPSSLKLLSRGAAESAPTQKLSVSPTGSVLVSSDSYGTLSLLETVNLRVKRNLSLYGTTGSFGYGIVSDGEIQSDLDAKTAVMYSANPLTAAATTAYTVPTLIFYDAQQDAALGTNSAVTAASAFRAGSTLNKASTSVGFRSEVPDSVDNNRGFLTTTASAASQFNSETYVATLATKRTITTGVDTTATLGVATVFGSGVVSGTPAAAINITLPTGTACDAHFQQLPNGYGSEWSVVNLSATPANTMTVVAGTGHGASGDLVVEGGTSARFLTYKTGANTFVTVRIA